MTMAERSRNRSRIDKALLVRSASDFFLLDVGRVRRVVDHLTVHPSPFSVPGLSGLARFGGGPLTVFSLESLVVGEPTVRHEGMTVVVIEVGESDSTQRLGLAVDEVLEIVGLGDRELGVAPDWVVSEPLEIDGRLARLLNVEALGSPGSIDRCPGVQQVKECT